MKYRQLPKQFWTRSGGRKVLYGYDDVWPGPDPASPLLDPATGLPLNHTIVIVEGEMDKLALNQAGLWNVVSVPFGAPSKAGDKQRNFESYDPLRDRNFSYIWECEDLLQGCQRVVIATDNDGPGYALQEELARRLGRWVRAAASALCGC
jgi:twinkle protein